MAKREHCITFYRGDATLMGLVTRKIAARKGLEYTNTTTENGALCFLFKTARDRNAVLREVNKFNDAVSSLIDAL